MSIGKLKVALVHDYLKEIGGAERVLMALKELFPQADVYTAYAFKDYWGEFGETIEGWGVRESWARWLPFLPRALSYYTVISPLFFRFWDLNGYDVVIVSATGAYFPNGVTVGVGTKLVTYCHTPPRFLYGYTTASKERYKWYWRGVSEVVNLVLRIVDYKLAQRPDMIVANSVNVARRVEKFYRRKAVVVYPPVGGRMERNSEGGVEDYYLIVSRIVGGKNVELGVRAAKEYGFRLKIAGRPIGKSGEEIVSMMEKEGVEYLGEVTEEEKWKLMSGAKGFLALSGDEDLGMTVIEAQRCGTPVVAYRGGGYLESIVEGKSGVFFDELTGESLWEGMGRLKAIGWGRQLIEKHARKFSAEEFGKRMERLVEQLVKGKGAVDSG